MTFRITVGTTDQEQKRKQLEDEVRKQNKVSSGHRWGRNGFTAGLAGGR